MLSRFLRKSTFALIAYVFISTPLSAQQRNAREIAIQFLRENPAQFGLTSPDVAALRVTDEYTSKHNGVTHVWLQQEHASIPVYNGLVGLHVIPGGSVKYVSHRFVPQIAQKINTTLPSLTATQALEMAIRHLQLNGIDVPRIHQKVNDKVFIFEKGNLSRSEIQVSACFQPSKDGSNVRLAWNMVIDMVNNSDIWSLRIDAQTGEVLDKVNFTVYCRAGHAHKIDETCPSDVSNFSSSSEQSEIFSANGSYRVFALPTESPAHGNRTLVSDPAHPVASPYGWHDINGAAGAEYNYTRGNNVWAYSDESNDNGGSVAESADGGAALTFDFPFDPDGEPNENRQAAITNLFYINNMMHDITYVYGFDEAAGNFQTNNYGRGGAGNDAVNAEALDGGGTDNANFSTPADGGPGRMQMYRWSRSGGNLVNVLSPAQVAGSYYGQAASGWGAEITEIPVVGDVVVVDAGGGTPTLGCDPALNDLTDKIVLVDRGVCEFGQKALNVEQAGAKACIICNFANSTAGMAAGSVGDQVTIPVLMMSKNDCDALRQFAGQGLSISLAQPVVSGPDFLDGDFDNGIIAHEYGHGISNRFTGGPSQAGCLGNAEQMGEGWSDWFSLIMTAKPGDLADQRRGVGTYVLREPNTGTGIRRYPYSTDMSIAPLTYGAVAENTAVHPIGEVWNNMLWDLYWAMVDKYGFDPNWQNTNSGNGRAIQLVMDGMKMQPCNPGFVDGRDAIILADIINYNGADTCLISQVFARRGLGLNASQGNSNDAGDGQENFEPIEVCVKELKIKKETSTPTINPGELASFTITVTNHKEDPVTNVVVTDELPQGLTLTFASNGGVASGGQVVWNLGTMASGQKITLTYAAQAGPEGSIRLYRDVMDDENDWFTAKTEGATDFFLQTAIKKTGNAAWKCNNLETETDLTLNKAEPLTISGNQPVLRFWNRFQTQAGADAGFLEFQKEGEQGYSRLSKSKTFRGGYPGAVSYSTFAIPFLDGFSGSSNGWMQSYFDLAEFNGTNIGFRFRFGTDGATGGDGWYIDELELIDMVNYDGEVCVTSTEGDNVCAKAPEKGIIVNPGTVGTDLIANNSVGMSIKPNPTNAITYVSFAQTLLGESMLSLVGTDGRIIYQRSLFNINAGESIPVDASTLTPGMYLIRVEHTSGTSIQKLLVK